MEYLTVSNSTPEYGASPAPRPPHPLVRRAVRHVRARVELREVPPRLRTVLQYHSAPYSTIQYPPVPYSTLQCRVLHEGSAPPAQPRRRLLGCAAPTTAVAAIGCMFIVRDS